MLVCSVRTGIWQMGMLAAAWPALLPNAYSLHVNSHQTSHACLGSSSMTGESGNLSSFVAFQEQSCEAISLSGHLLADHDTFTASRVFSHIMTSLLYLLAVVPAVEHHGMKVCHFAADCIL